jgi:chromate transporter
MIAVLLQLAGLFLLLSLLAVGGGNAVLPDMPRAVVDLHHWISAREFLDLFALSRVAPGPGSLIVALIGQRAAGLPGAAVAVLAMFGPSCLLVYGAARLWHRHREAAWRAKVERGLAPVAIGLVFASAIALMRGTESAWSAYALSAASTLVLTTSEIHPLWVLAAGAAAGWGLGL